MTRKTSRKITMQLDAEKLIDVLVDKIGTLTDNTEIIGIHTGGAWVAARLASRLGLTQYGTLAATLHRDDFTRRGLHPQTRSTDIPFAVDGKHILLIDDVLQTGRTIRAAMNELFDFGRPQSVTLAVLIDRGGRELPIEANHVAMVMPLSTAQRLTLTEDNKQLRFDIKES
jgi:pyrimidine operon attenuation protein / uracil phosphoribosyltransferase